MTDLVYSFIATIWDLYCSYYHTVRLCCQLFMGIPVRPHPLLWLVLYSRTSKIRTYNRINRTEETSQWVRGRRCFVVFFCFFFNFIFYLYFFIGTAAKWQKSKRVAIRSSLTLKNNWTRNIFSWSCSGVWLRKVHNFRLLKRQGDYREVFSWISWP